MNPKYEGLDVYKVTTHYNGRGFTAAWTAPLLGFGEVQLWVGDDGKVHIDSERMSSEFVACVLSKIVEHCVIDD